MSIPLFDVGEGLVVVVVVPCLDDVASSTILNGVLVPSIVKSREIE